ncbi:MurR/RpiR family transcriptional regulator [Pisciglobus halotolerans]|uniref:DNA-binding transcriptional regulator, MurR/RpiR family, contains HTH and SIS domains n=1 Tax=Pisciglobus halotolerans TaxID=745365 RepID=A0A1I3CBD8_9LACT|nr:MurR/RpiR family transcriptional regulator [Pisciglobus halotolerans]SFH71842.1 DNA-binding transcriptional regulator, MurR/RpiR family, contains HTH and SIS domains [Pisciglobus halotolerans]
MKDYKKSIVPYIESMVNQLTPLEQKIAQYFIEYHDPLTDFSSKNISTILYVSEASLTRFAKKCGFSGYREFIYLYQESLTNPQPLSSNLMTNVIDNYQEILNKTYSIIEEEKIIRITQLLLSQNRVYIYGKGSSGSVANEMKFRFMRIGLVCEAITDNHIMRMNQVILDEDCLVIGLSISGQTEEVLNGLKAAKKRGAKTILFTANQTNKILDYCDEIQLFALKDNLSKGNIISPQLPILIIIDIIYAFFMETNRQDRQEMWQDTFEALQEKED